MKKGGVKPGISQNPMRETRANAKSPMRHTPKRMTVTAKKKGG